MSTINLTTESAIELLQKLGVDVALADSPENATENVDFEAIVSEVIKAPEPAELSKEDIAKIENAAIGRVHGEYRTAFANSFGARTKDLEELKLDAKGLAQKMRETVDSRYSAKQEELSRQVEDLTSKLNGKDTEYETKLSEVETSWNRRFQERDTLENINSVLGKIPKSGNTTKQSRAFLKDLQDEYDVRYDAETKQSRLYIKNTDELVMDGKNPLSIDKVASDWVTDMGFAVTDTSNIPPATVPPNGQGADFSAGAQQNQPAMGVADGRDVHPAAAQLMNAIKE